MTVLRDGTGPEPRSGGDRSLNQFRYRLKPAPLGGDVTALRYEGANRQACSDFLGDRYGFDAPYVLIRGDDDDLRVPVGDWLVRDSWGQFFSSPHENFVAWYEPVNELREALQGIAAYADDFPGSEPLLRVRDMAMEALGDV